MPPTKERTRGRRASDDDGREGPRARGGWPAKQGHACTCSAVVLRELLNGLSDSHLSGGGELPPSAEGGPAAAAAAADAAARRSGVAPRGNHEAVGGGGGGRGCLVDVDVHGAERGAEGVDARQALAPTLFT